jgi:hypothetical protein
MALLSTAAAGDRALELPTKQVIHQAVMPAASVCCSLGSLTGFAAFAAQLPIPGLTWNPVALRLQQATAVCYSSMLQQYVTAVRYSSTSQQYITAVHTAVHYSSTLQQYVTAVCYSSTSQQYVTAAHHSSTLQQYITTGTQLSTTCQ